MSPAGESLDAQYEAIYREYAPRVRALARRRLSGRDVSDDVVQEVFMRLLRALPELDLERPIWPWLRTVCVNICTDVLRSPRTWAEEPVEAFSDVQTSQADIDPVSLVVADEQRQAIGDALDTLPARQRGVLLRRVLDGATSEDMAEGEGTTVEAVKSAVKRGRQAFRRAYTDIARERGLLGAPGPSFPERFRELSARSRAAYDACLRVCNSPGWQSVPVAVSAAVLAIGWGAGPHGRSQAEAALGPRGSGDAGVERVLGAAAFAGSSSGATRPGGGAPPSSPPGQDRGGANAGGPPPPPDPTRVKATTDSGVDDPEKGMFWFRVDFEVGGEYLGFVQLPVHDDCDLSAVRATACAAAKEHWPEDRTIQVG